jgi:hypothetical protein
MNPIIDPKVLEALAQKWPEDFLIKNGFFAVLKPGMAACAFKITENPEAQEATPFPLQHEHLDLIRGRLERIAEGKFGEPPYYSYSSAFNCYSAYIEGANRLFNADSTNNYTEAVAIAALKAEGVDIAP